jgi:hypothetical protein
VGGNSETEADATVLRREDGVWRTETLPTLTRPGVDAFFKVWGTAADDVWIVGRRGAILHWDGATYTEFDAGTGQDLIAVWGHGPRPRRRRGRAQQRDLGGVGRTDLDLARAGRDARAQRGLDASEGRHPRRRRARHPRGARRERRGRARPHHVETETDLHAVFGLPSGRLTGVGGNFLFANGPYEGLAMWRALRSGE